MEEHVSWVLEVAVKPGELDTYKALMEEMVEGTSTEPRTLNYEWYINEDEDVSFVAELRDGGSGVTVRRSDREDDSGCSAGRGHAGRRSKRRRSRAPAAPRPRLEDVLRS